MKAKLTKTKKLTKNMKFIKKHTQQINIKNHTQAQKKITHTHIRQSFKKNQKKNDK